MGKEACALTGRSVLILRPGALGDTILALPAIRALRCAVGPMGRIELVGHPAAAHLALNPLHADAVHSIDRATFAGLYSEWRASEVEEFLRRFGLVVAWSYDADGHLSRLLERMGMSHVLADPYPGAGVRLHVSDHLVHTLRPLGIRGPSAFPELAAGPRAGGVAEEYLRANGIAERSFLAIHPGSGSAEKNWPKERFSQLAEFADKSALPYLLIEGEADRDTVSQLIDILPGAPVVAKSLDLCVLGSLLSRATAYVGNDSGITHLAAAAGAPTVALFGPTDPAVWAPRGPQVRVLSLEADASTVWAEVIRSRPSGPPGSENVAQGCPSGFLRGVPGREDQMLRASFEGKPGARSRQGGASAFTEATADPATCPP